MFMLVSWCGLTLPLLNAADWFRWIRLLTRLFVSSHLSEVIYVWCYCWRNCFFSCWWRPVLIVLRGAKNRLKKIIQSAPTKNRSKNFLDLKGGSARKPGAVADAGFHLEKNNKL